jgi:asparagine synthetase B (glutamine-hydrolysing)
MLSGGLDSIPIAILTSQDSDDLLAFSWVFEEFPNLDERQYSVPVCEQFGIEQVMINCDRLWPQFDATMDLNPIVPFGIPFSEFQEETLGQAKRRGVTVMLTGIHGDLLYEYTNGVLYELLKAREWSKFYAEFSCLWRAASSPSAFIKHYFLRPLRIVQWLSAKRRQKTPAKSDMLLKELADVVIEKPHWLLSNSSGALRPKQWQVVLDAFAGDDAVHGRYLDAKYAVERRYPFRDRDLCEFMLSIPSHQLYFALQKRPIVKQAFSKEFGPSLLERNNKTVFSDIIYAGVAKDTKSRQWYESQPAQWSDYVKYCYFDAQTAQNPSLEVVRWRCGYYDYWKSVCYNPLAQASGLTHKNEHENTKA